MNRWKEALVREFRWQLFLELIKRDVETTEAERIAEIAVDVLKKKLGR